MKVFNLFRLVRASCAFCLLLGTANMAHAQNVIAWGDDSKGQTNVPPEATNVIAVAAGWFHSLALKSDGSVVTWGASSNAPASATNIISIAAGAYHSLALRSDGRVVAWGSNFLAQISVPNAATNVVAIAAGDYHSVALRADGRILAWGADDLGQIDIPFSASNFVGIAAGRGHTVGIRADGSGRVWCVKKNWPLPLFQFRPNQLAVPGDTVSVTAAGWHSLCLHGDGTLLSWGLAGPVPTEATNIIAMAPGTNFDLALRADGAVVAWAEWGTTPTTSGLVTNLPPNLTNIVAIAAGLSHGLAVTGQGRPQICGPAKYRDWALAGNSLPLSVHAFGAYPMHYQWLEDGVPIPNTDTPFPRIPAGLGKDGANYQVIVSNDFGSITSAVANVAVRLVQTWGANADRQSTMPSGLTNCVAVAAGGFHGLALNTDGSVSAWGKNIDGQASVPASATNVVSVAAGGDHSLALKNDGTVLAWGRNWDGQTSVPTEATNLVAVSAGRAHCLALRADGTVVAWGNDELGQTDVPLLATKVIAIAAGYYHNMALRSDGTVITWGLTYSTTRGSSVDYPVPSEATNVVAIAAGWQHCLALRRDGTMVAWGDNSFGQSTIPVGASNVVAIAAGYYHSMALTEDGQIIAWGKGSYGVTNVQAGLRNVTAIAAGEDYSTLLVATGRPQFSRQLASVLGRVGGQVTFSPVLQGARPMNLQWYRDGIAISGATNRSLVLANAQVADSGSYTLVASNDAGEAVSEPIKLSIDSQPATISIAGGWGNNFSGQLSVPRAVVSPRAIAAGSYHGLALNADGTVAAWGKNYDGQTNVPSAATNVIAIAAGGYHSLALREDGTVVGWGRNWDGQTSIPPEATNIVAVAAGYAHSLALRDDGTVLAWGNNDSGQTNVFPLTGSATAIAAGYYHSLALRKDGSVVAWGLLNYVPEAATNVVGIAGGWWHSLALRADGSVLAWGDNRYGQCDVPPTASNIVAIAAGYYHSVALRDDGTVLVWGSSLNGVTNIPTCLRNVTALAAGEDFNLAIVEEGPPRFSSPAESVAARTGGKATLSAKFSGTYPLTCQWVHEGLPVPGATGRWLTLTNLQPADAGTYTLIVTNGIGQADGQTTTLTIDPSPAVEGVANLQTVPVGSVLNLSPAVAGEEPLSYKWQVNGVDLTEDGHFSGSSTSSLRLRPARYGDSGDYSLILSNAYGCSTGLVARVMVNQVVGWGDNSDGQLWPPASATNLVALASAAYHCLGLRADGSLVAWGDNDAGQNNVPQAQPPHKFIAIAESDSYSLALKSDGTVVAWGNAYLQTNVPSAATNVVAISAGTRSALALRLDGAIITWGGYQSPVPTSATNVVAIAAGLDFNFAVRADGQVVQWSSLSPVPKSATNVLAMAVTGGNALALQRGGSVIGWQKYQSNEPPILHFSRDVLAIATGTNYYLAVLADGSIQAWGDNSFGQIEMPESLTNVVAVAAGYAHSLALINDGSATNPVGRSLPYVVNLGSRVVLGYGIPNSVPRTSQWFHNGIALPDVSDPFLVLPNVQGFDAGQYDLVTTDVGGRTNRQSFSLVVVGPVRMELGTPYVESQWPRQPLRVTGLTGSGGVIIYASSNLVDWEVILTNAPTRGPLDFIETLYDAPQQRFYRASETR